MDWLLSDDAEHIAIPSDKPDSLRDKHLWIPAANRRDVGEPLVVDVSHDDADLVDVTREHDRRRALGIHLGDAVAGDITAHFRESRGFFAPDLRGCRLES